MSEKKVEAAPERTMADVQNQYTALCNKAGHLNYQIQTHKKDLDLIYTTLRDLNFEAASIQAKDQAKSAEAALAKAQAEKAANSAPVAVPQELPAIKKPRKLKEVKANA